MCSIISTGLVQTFSFENDERDASFCFYCMLNHYLSEKPEPIFIKTGYRNWKRTLKKKKGYARHQRKK